MQAVFKAPKLQPSYGYRQAVIENALLSSRLFSGLSPAQLARLLPVAGIKVLNPAEQLFFEGQSGGALFVVQSGAIRLFRSNASGNEQVVHVARAGESFAEESLFGEGCYSLNAAAIQQSRVVALPRNELLALFRSSPELLMRVTLALSKHLREMIGLLDDLRLKSARARLGNWLLNRIPKPESHAAQSITLSLPKKTIAAELGMVSETFSRLLAQLQAEHLLVVHGRTLILQDPCELSVTLAREETNSRFDTRRLPSHAAPFERALAVVA